MNATLLIQYVPAFLLILVRISSFFVTVPIFSSRGVPSRLKIGTAFFISILVFFQVGIHVIPMDFNFFIHIFKELAVGLALGFIAALFIYGIQVAGSFIDMQIGFAIANVIDPQTGAQSPLIGNFKYMLAVLFFLAMDGHHLFIQAIQQSYTFIPLQQLTIPLGSENVMQFVTHAFITMFEMAFKMAVPIVATLFLVDIALGIVAKTVPQLNVFVVGLPLKILISFIVLLVALPGFFYLLKILFATMFEAISTLMQLLGEP